MIDRRAPTLDGQLHARSVTELIAVQPQPQPGRTTGLEHRPEDASAHHGHGLALVRAGDLRILVDAGLPPRAMRERLDAARLPPAGGGIDHVLVTHAHLDHARSAGVIQVPGCPSRETEAQARITASKSSSKLTRMPSRRPRRRTDLLDRKARGTRIALGSGENHGIGSEPSQGKIPFR